MAKCISISRDDGYAAVIGIQLSRRNITTLLAKLDGFPPNSACEIQTYDGFRIIAEEDDFHYVDRTPGLMHPDTEEVLNESQR